LEKVKDRIKPDTLLVLDISDINPEASGCREDGILGACPLYSDSYCVSYGFPAVAGLPNYAQQLYLLVVKGLGSKPLMLLTTEPLRRNRAVLTRVAKMYFRRWKIEESIRFVKQSFDLENIRLLRYQSIRNMLALLFLVFFFLCVMLDLNQKFKIMTGHILACSKRVFGIPQFTYYALGDGIRLIFVRSPVKPFYAIATTQNDQQLRLF